MQIFILKNFGVKRLNITRMTLEQVNKLTDMYKKYNINYTVVFSN